MPSYMYNKHKIISFMYVLYVLQNKHENIICIYDIMTDPPNSLEFDDIYIVTNLMESDLGDDLD